MWAPPRRSTPAGRPRRAHGKSSSEHLPEALLGPIFCCAPSGAGSEDPSLKDLSRPAPWWPRWPLSGGITLGSSPGLFSGVPLRRALRAIPPGRSPRVTPRSSSMGSPRGPSLPGLPRCGPPLCGLPRPLWCAPPWTCPGSPLRRCLRTVLRGEPSWRGLRVSSWGAPPDSGPSWAEESRVRGRREEGLGYQRGGSRSPSSPGSLPLVEVFIEGLLHRVATQGEGGGLRVSMS